MRVIHFILATAGHVDHGKSSLVIALTGTDPDRLPEEKSRGITIELGFAHLDLAAREGKIFRVGVVDVPGHEDFVKNMVAGVGSIDVAMIVVAADDGWMPQTEEHLQILEYLGVTRGLVALTKSDLVADESHVREQVRARLAESSLRDALIVSTSTKTNRGIDELKRALGEVLSQAPLPRDIGKPRLALDRAFTLRGIGTVVTGTLGGGELRRGQSVMIQPAGIVTRIRNLQSHNQDVEVAQPGSRVAINLGDVEPRTEHSALGDLVVGRGDVVTIESLGKATEVIDVILTRSPRAPTRAIKDGAIVQIHHGTRAMGAKVQLIDRKQLLPGERSRARLRLHSSLFGLVGDRFVVRDWSEQQTLAGGVVLEMHPQKKLAGFAEDASILTLVSAIIARSTGVARAGILVQSIYSPQEIDRAIDLCIEAGDVVAVGSLVCPRNIWDASKSRAIEAVDAHHLAHPDQIGLQLSAVRPKIEAAIFDPMVDHLCANGFARRGTTIARAAHVAKLPANLQSAGDAIRAALRQRPLDPLSRAQLAGDPTSFQAMKFLINSGEVVEISKEIVLWSAALDDAIARIRQHLHANGPATVSELKNLLKSSRRIMVPLLEKLDRDGITRRIGDRRELK